MRIVHLVGRGGRLFAASRPAWPRSAARRDRRNRRVSTAHGILIPRHRLRHRRRIQKPVLAGGAGEDIFFLIDLNRGVIEPCGQGQLSPGKSITGIPRFQDVQQRGVVVAPKNGATEQSRCASLLCLIRLCAVFQKVQDSCSVSYSWYVGRRVRPISGVTRLPMLPGINPRCRRQDL